MSIVVRRASEPRLCFIAHNAYGALIGANRNHIGGIERQIALMARWFAHRGHAVSIITWDEGQEEGTTVDGVQLLKMCSRDSGIKGLRFLWPRWLSLCQAMQRANADVYYYNNGDGVLGQIALWCSGHNRRCVYSAAANRVCDVKHVTLQPLRERMLYQYGLRHVHSIVVQTRAQQKMLRDGFGVNSTVIAMPCEGFGPRELPLPARARGEGPRALWVGRISEEKRFEWFLDVAKRCPDMPFDVVGASNSDSPYACELTKRAAGIRNVNMLGRIAHADIADYYRRCRVLCCTSAYEGFPNTFLEAWSQGLPVVTTFDPDGIVAKHGLGWAASNIDEIVNGLKTAIGSPEKWRAASEAALSYYLQNHTMDATMPKFETLFSKLVAG